MNEFQKMSDTQLIMAALWRLMMATFSDPGTAGFIKDELNRRIMLEPNTEALRKYWDKNEENENEETSYEP